jgi:lipoprotein-releasing system ATP-binding protein
VALARTLANDRAIIVVDGPTGNLDKASTEQVFGVLRDIAGQGRTVIVVMHDPGLVAREIVDGKIARETWLSKERPADPVELRC